MFKFNFFFLNVDSHIWIRVSMWGINCTSSLPVRFTLLRFLKGFLIFRFGQHSIKSSIFLVHTSEWINFCIIFSHWKIIKLMTLKHVLFTRLYIIRDIDKNSRVINITNILTFFLPLNSFLSLNSLIFLQKQRLWCCDVFQNHSQKFSFYLIWYKFILQFISCKNLEYNYVQGYGT